MNAEEIRSLCARRTAAICTHDVATLMADYADDCVLESPMFGTVAGREGVAQSFVRWFEGFPDSQAEHVDLVIEGNRVVHMLAMSGTDTLGVLGHAPTGKPFRLLLVNVFRLDGGHIVDERRVYDIAGLLMQLSARHSSDARTPVYQTALELVRIQQEVDIAAEIQRALLPDGNHGNGQFEVAASSLPCRAIGGDFFDYSDLPNGAFGFALGDVTGKGPPAALLAAELQGAIAAHADRSITASGTVARANLILARRPIASRFATMVYGILSADGTLTYCNGGHNPPFLLGRENVRRLDKGGMILGAFSNTVFEEETVPLNAGDVLVAFTDGVTEAVNNEGAEFGDERLLACIQANLHLAPTELLKRVIDSVRAFCGDVSQSDDLTLFVLRYIKP